MFVTYLARAIDKEQIHFRTNVVTVDLINACAIAPNECWFMVPGTVED